MMQRRWLGHVKSGVLVLLVLASLVLSFLLWAGFWKGSPTSVGTEVLPTPESITPTDTQVAAPYQMVSYDAGRGHTTLLLPGGKLFEAVLTQLQQTHVSGVRTSANEAVQNTITLEFGYPLTEASLGALMPGLKPMTVSGNSITFNEDPWTNVVSLVVAGYDGTDWYTTDISATTFSHWLADAAKLTAWVAPPQTAQSYVPQQAITMDETTWNVKSPLQMSLVRSFFVNPLALTSLSESGQSNVWTDGSRIVWWNQPHGDLTYQDPNVTSSATTNLPTVSVAANFVRAHGGSPTDVVVLTQPSGAGIQSINTVTLRPYLEGYPVVYESADYQVQFMMNQITQYVRPIWSLSNQIVSKRVRVLGYTGLTAAMKRLSPDFSWSQLSVQLGYATSWNTTGTVTLVPAYSISSDGLPLWTLSAVTGRPMKGWSAS